MSEPTVLLINPWVYDFALFDLYLKPLGLLYIASHLKKCGVNVLLLDCLNRFDEYFVNKNLIFNKKYGTGKYYYEIIESLRKESLLTPINELYYLHKVARTYFKVKQVNKAREIVERSLRIENKFEDKKRLELFEAQRKKFLKLKNEIQEYEKQNK